MSTIPENLKYTKDHEWLRLEEDGTATIGVTDYAQESLGDVTFVEVPETGTSFDAVESFGVVESVKAASDLYMPASGEVIEINGALEDSPDLVNTAPYTDGWLIKIKLQDPSELDSLMTPEAYSEIV